MEPQLRQGSMDTPPKSPGDDIWAGIEAVLFDLDGVLTPTAAVHERAWGVLFQEYLASIGETVGYRASDYFDYIDGKPRFEGVRDFLASRGITLPEYPDPARPERGSIQSLGNRKNAIFNAILETERVGPYPGSLKLLASLRARGLRLAVVSSSRNASAVLRAASLSDVFPVVIDGQFAAREGLPGKPDPATFLRAAELLGVQHSACIVLEDAVAGVQAGAAGNFRVVGVDRGVGAKVLREAGAGHVVNDLAELI